MDIYPLIADRLKQDRTVLDEALSVLDRRDVRDVGPAGRREKWRRILLLAKLCVGRDKDIELLQGLVDRGLIDLDKLSSRYEATPMDEALMFRSGRVLNRLRTSP